MKFGQPIEYNVTSIFLQKSFRNGAGRLVPVFAFRKGFI